MDRTDRYRNAVRQVIDEFSKIRLAHGEVETEVLIDRERDHYEVYHIGWQGQRRVHAPVIHIDIRDGKVWIQFDGTDRPVADELIAAGIPKEDIVLGFHPPSVRKYTEFAVG